MDLLFAATDIDGLIGGDAVRTLQHLLFFHHVAQGPIWKSRSIGPPRLGMGILAASGSQVRDYHPLSRQVQNCPRRSSGPARDGPVDEPLAAFAWKSCDLLLAQNSIG